jgi:hypothetical protein
MRQSIIQSSAVNPLRAYQHLGKVSNTERPIPLVATAISVRIDGGLATVKTARTFRNTEHASIEATMTFPVPVHATLLKLEATIGGRTVMGTAQRRKQARTTYEDAIDSGKSAVLHEEALRGIHIISVGHIAPGAEITVTGTWAMPLSADGKTAFLRIPVTVGDIFGQSPLCDADDLVHGGSRQTASLEIACSGGTPTLLGGTLNNGRTTVDLDAPIDIEIADWKQGELRGIAADGRPVALNLRTAPSASQPIRCRILVDHSGSMQATASGMRSSDGPSKHQVVVAALAKLAPELREVDELELWEFDDHANPVRGSSFLEAVRRLQEPHGGTRIGGAIKGALHGYEGHDIWLITDGKSHDIDVQDLARTGSRFNVVLIGEDALEAHVGYLAALTGGQLFVAAGDDAEAAVKKAFSALRLPQSPQKRINDWPVTAQSLIGGMAASAVWGRTIVGINIVGINIPVMLEGVSGPNHAVAITGKDGDGTIIEATADPVLSRSVSAVAAAMAIPYMDEDAAAALAEAEGIVCHLTSLVLVDEAGAVQEGVPAQRKVALMSPRTMSMANGASLAICASGYTGAEQSMTSYGGQGVFRRSLSTKITSSPTQTGWSSSLHRDAVGPRAVPTGERSTLGSVIGIPGGGMQVPEMIDTCTPLPGMGIPTTTPAKPGPSSSLRSAMGQVDWASNPEEFRKGSLVGMPPSVSVNLLLAARIDMVLALAKALGVDAIVVAIGLLAQADGAKDRTAARIGRSILGRADGVLLAKAQAALSL